jgi:hypothetical protein
MPPYTKRQDSRVIAHLDTETMTDCLLHSLLAGRGCPHNYPADRPLKTAKKDRPTPRQHGPDQTDKPSPGGTRP